MRLAGPSFRTLVWCLAAAVLAVWLAYPLRNGILAASDPLPQGLVDDGSTTQVLAFDDTDGYLEFAAQGNRGSHFTVRAEFKGFYVVPQLAATRLKRAYGSSAPLTVADLYEIIPRELKVTADIAGTYSHETTKNGFTIRSTVQHTLDRHFIVQSPRYPAGEQPLEALLLWSALVTDAQPRHDPNYQCRILIRDATPVGGKATVQARLSLGLEGTYQETQENNIPGGRSPRTSVKDGKYSFQFSASDAGRTDALVDTRSWPSVKFFTTAFEVTDPISLDDFRIVTARSGSVAHSGQPSYGMLLSDTTYALKASLRIGATTPYAFLDPADVNEQRWIPEPGQDREYVVSIEDDNLDSVQALRVTLADTSAHPGVATNGGNHVRGDACSDCRAGRTTTGWRWSGPFGDTTGAQVTISRSYQHYNLCPIDGMPDVFFVDRDNPGWTFADDAAGRSAALQYVIGQQMTIEKDIQAQTRIKVRIMDGAASSRLSAEVKIAGAWFPVTARGATSERNGAYLMLPLDTNQNGLQDGWEHTFGSPDPDADAEASPPGAGPGDGLTVFEEYRGIHTRGMHRRLWPDTRELFVHDYTALLDTGLTRAAGLAKDAVELVRLRGDEFNDDVVNYLQGTPHKAGRQSIVVVMSADQAPGVNLEWAGGIAARLGPPQPGANTVIVRYAPQQASDWSPAMTTFMGTLLAHEIGHLMNMPHHGTGEGVRSIAGRNTWVACVNGQHSGDTTCVMRYFGAPYMFDGNPVPDPLKRDPVGSAQVKAFSASESATHFCTTRAGASDCLEAATGRGACLTKLKIRSY